MTSQRARGEASRKRALTALKWSLDTEGLSKKDKTALRKSIAILRALKGRWSDEIVWEIDRQYYGASYIIRKADALRKSAPAENAEERRKRLAAAMMAAHPDHGGTADQFREAHAAWKASR
jgi:hypothetical protein